MEWRYLRDVEQPENGEESEGVRNSKYDGKYGILVRDRENEGSVHRFGLK